jgi:hypothetical protein
MSRRDVGERSARAHPDPTPQSLLIVQLGSLRLREEGLAYGEMAAYLASFIGLPFNIVEAESALHLKQKLAKLPARNYEIILVVSHSAEYGVLTGPDEWIRWRDLGRALYKFDPERLLLLACSAGRSDPGKALFSTLPGLELIFASPVWASHIFGAHLILLAPILLLVPNVSVQFLRAAVNGTTLLADGGQLRIWTRADLMNAANFDTAKYRDRLADLLDGPRRDIAIAYHKFMNRLFPLAQSSVPPRPPVPPQPSIPFSPGPVSSAPVPPRKSKPQRTSKKRRKK